MRKKLVNEKREQLKQLPRQELVNRILRYHDQDALNEDRKYPIGKMAEGIRDRGYAMSDRQYYTLVHHFAAATVPEMKVVGVTFQKNNVAEFEKTQLSQEGTKTVYETDYVLRPEPENEYDKNAVMVMARTEAGLHQIGYLSRDFVAKHPITEEMSVHGLLTDHSNGKFKNVSYSLAVDVEALHNRKTAAPALDAAGEDELYHYAMPFSMTHQITDARAAEQAFDSRFIAETLTGNLQIYGFDTKCVDAAFSFDGPFFGQVFLATDEPLSPGSEGSKSVVDSYFAYQMASGLMADRLRAHGVMPDNVPLSANVFDACGGFSPQAPAPVKEPPVREQPLLTEADLEFGKQMELADFGIV